MDWLKKHRTAVTVVLVFAAFLLGCFLFVWTKLGLIQYDRPRGDPPQPEPDVSAEEARPQEQPEKADWPELPEGSVYHDPAVLNLMLLGTDERTDSFSTNARSDSMILVSLNRETGTVRLVSLERGMGVPVLEGPYKGQYDWLTHMFRYGGAELVLKTVRECLLVDTYHYVRVNFNTVETVIDAIGGIDVDMTEQEAWYFSNAYVDGRPPVQRKAGLNHLNGRDALSYARLREIDSDWNRVQRQRAVIVAVIDRLKDSGLAELNSFVNEVLPLVKTNLTRMEIAQLMLSAPGFLPPRIEQLTIPARDTYTGGMIGMGGRSLYRVDFAANAALLREFLYGKT